MSKVVTRIAPSPTGYLHFGLARTALFSYLYAKKLSGEYILRIEDTDTARNRPEYEADILDQFEWLHLTPDRSYRQSEQVDRHKQLLQQLVDKDVAYVSKEAAKDDASRTVEVVRLRNKGEKITFNDLIRGEISFDTTELKDFVIARSMDEPLFHFAVVVDDHDEGVTHIIRGDDHISNTPRQILIHRALGFEVPAYAHLPLILMPDKSKMSKRKHETALKTFREIGILPEAIINYLALLGWTPPSGKEILSLDEMIPEFDLKDLHKSGAVFDMEKLRWFNREYLLKMRDDDFDAEALRRLEHSLNARKMTWDETIGHKLLPLLRERTHVWSDIDAMVGAGELDLFFTDPQPEAAAIPQKATSPADAVKYLRSVSELLSAVSNEDFSDAEKVKAAVWAYAEQEGRGAVLWPLRFSLSGRQKSPDPFMIASTIGKSVTLRRLNTAITLLSSDTQ
jgi:glutamyl-tRNA synthetase